MTNFYPNYTPYYSPQNTMQQINNVPQLNGKIVDSADVVRATEVPFGGFGIFPKGDLSEVYIKSWNNNGTTQITTFRPFTPEPQIDMTTLLLEKINNIEEKINSLTSNKEQPQPISTAEEKKRKETIASVY